MPEVPPFDGPFFASVSIRLIGVRHKQRGRPVLDNAELVRVPHLMRHVRFVDSLLSRQIAHGDQRRFDSVQEPGCGQTSRKGREGTGSITMTMTI
jgi:hypothetical protein